MTRGLRIGHILGLPIEIDITWFILVALVTVVIARRVLGDVGPEAPGAVVWLLGVLTALGLLASLLAHELAHSLVARRLGIEVGGVTLFLLGGVARMGREPDSPAEEWRMAAAGPACSLGLAAFFAALAVWTRLLALDSSLAVLCNWLAAMNAVVAVFNLLPGLPLDGGRLLRAGIWRASGDFLRATRQATLAGKALGCLLIALGVVMLLLRQFLPGVLSVFVGWFLIHLASKGYQRARFQRALEGVPVSAVMSHDVAAVPADISVQQLVRARLPRQARAAYLVARGDELVGRVSLRDLRGVARERWAVTRVGDVARPLRDDEVVGPETASWEALTQLARSDHPHLLVVREGRLLGVLRRRDLVRLLRAAD